MHPYYIYIYKGARDLLKFSQVLIIILNNVFLNSMEVNYIHFRICCKRIKTISFLIHMFCFLTLTSKLDNYLQSRVSYFLNLNVVICVKYCAIISNYAQNTKMIGYNEVLLYVNFFQNMKEM